LEGLATPFQGIAQGIVNLGTHFTNILNYLNPFSDNFILKNVIEFLGNIISYLNPFSENFILKNVIDFLGNLVSYVNPFSDNFLGKKIVELFSDLLNTLFVPTQDHFTELSNKFNQKFAFISQIEELVSDLFTVSSTASDSAPEWNITYEGTTVNIIDFTAFEQYRGVVHGIIIAVMYIPFFLRLYRRLPRYYRCLF